MLEIPQFKERNKEEETFQKHTAMLEEVVKLPLALVWLRPERKHQNRKMWTCKQKASPVIMHLHLHRRFIIRDAGKWPTHLGKTQMWMKKFPGCVELLAFSSIYAGSLLSTKDKQLYWWSNRVLEMIGWGLIVVTNDLAELESLIHDRLRLIRVHSKHEWYLQMSWPSLRA